MIIFYSKKSKFFNIINEALININILDRITINLSFLSSQKGYEGIYEIDIKKDSFIVNFDNTHSRFPQRIKSAATILARLESYGKYIISHKNKMLTIQKI